MSETPTTDSTAEEDPVMHKNPYKNLIQDCPIHGGEMNTQKGWMNRQKGLVNRRKQRAYRGEVQKMEALESRDLQNLSAFLAFSGESLIIAADVVRTGHPDIEDLMDDSVLHIASLLSPPSFV